MLSWNIHGLTGEKKENSEFVNILEKHDICFMFESWCDSSSNVDLNGYVSHNFYRKFRHRKARRNSGGIILYYKEDIQEGIQIIKNHFDTIIWVKLDKTFFKLSEDIFLCGVYIWGEGSPVYNNINADLFDILENDLCTYDSKGNVYLFGDFNSRVGTKNDFIVHDKLNSCIDDVSYDPDCISKRSTLDRSHNSHGIRLSDLCKASQYRILNGRMDDTNEYTFLSHNGCSIIDYLITRECDFKNIAKFSIGNFNEWSDHAPLHFSLLCNNFVPEKSQYSETRYKWDESLRQQFRSGIISNLQRFNTIVKGNDSMDRGSVDTMLNDFTQIVCDVSDPLFSKTFLNKNHVHFSSTRSERKDWFDEECIDARNVYLASLHTFNENKSSCNRENLCERKRLYKSIVSKKRNANYRKKMQTIENLRKRKPKEFWKHFKGNSSKKSDKISLDEFCEYFKKLGDSVFNSSNEESENFNSNHDFNTNNEIFPELDKPFSVQEILDGIKTLKKCKAPGNDTILNEYFIESSDILCAHLCDLFNHILDSGCYPKTWTEGIIIPIHKKGSISDVNNYRGITLLSCLSKLFTTVLNKRVEGFCEENNFISDAQFGFRKGYSTTDAIFVLHSLIQNFLFNNKRLYVIFVDMMKCFDSIYRNGLWLKLYKLGLKGKILRIVRDMYTSVKSCVKSCSSYSDYFKYAVGLRQGEVMSPLLFSLFIEDLELWLQQDNDAGINIDDVTLMLLLFADDMAIVGKTPNEIQGHLDHLLEYCNYWGLKVNIDKTKIVVFRKRGKLLPMERWTYDGHTIDTVNDFNYLGVLFNYTGNFSLNQEHLIGKALKAMNVLLCKCREYDLKPKILCQLFDSFVSSILNYSSEIWGCTKSKEIERIHLKFCKRLLKVKNNSCNATIYGELGRYPLYISRYVRIIKYWFKVVNSENILIASVYKQALKDSMEGCHNWVYNVKKMLDDFGYSHIFYNCQNIHVNAFITSFKNRVIDTFKQDWQSTLDNSTMLDTYRQFKTSFEYEEYLDLLPRSLRFYFCRLRMSVHNLRIQTDRYARNNVPRNERYCLCCNSRDIEDEFHFICICPCFMEIRRKYLDRRYYVNPSVYKYLELLKSTCKNKLINLSLFVKESLYIRSTILTIVR